MNPFEKVAMTPCRWLRPSPLGCRLAAGVLLLASAAAPAPGETRSFLHIASAGNLGCSGGFCTFFDDPCLDTNDGAMVLVTHVWNPPGQPTHYLDQPLGHDIEPVTFRHRLVSGITTLEAGTGFNVIALCGSSVIGIPHTTNAGNTVENRSYLDHGTINGNDFVPMLVFGNGTPGFVLNSPYGVRYDSSNSRWAIFLEDLDPMPAGEFFWVVPTTSPSWEELGITPVVHEATALDTTLNYTFVDHPALNGNPDAIVVVSQHMMELGMFHNPHYIGMYYNSGNGRWGIFNEDLAPMPIGARFFLGVATLIADGDFETGGTETWSAATP